MGVHPLGSVRPAMNKISPKPRSEEAERRALSRAKIKAMREAGLSKFPRDVCPKLETMEAFYDVGERLGTEDPAEILNAVFLTLQENQDLLLFIEKIWNARCPRDINAADAVLHYSHRAVMSRVNRLMDEGHD